MKTITITVDVEPDATKKSWSTSNPISFNGVFEGIRRIEKVVGSFSVPVTYFIQPVILFNNECVDYLKTLHGEMATHLHGEYIEPNAKYRNTDFSGCDPYEKQNAYPKNIEMKKMKNLTNLFVQKFGYKPLSFRAGRFGIGENTFDCLNKLEYTHDSSIVPNHKTSKNVKNYSTFLPYKYNNIIEVPVTVNKKGKWLRPTPGYSSLKDIKTILDQFSNYNSNVCCMFHNVEVLPGISPYCSTEKECSKMLDLLSMLIEYALKLNYVPSKTKDIKI